MSLRINTNVDAQAAHRYLSTTSDAVSKSMERLSSGLRINKAADDAAGLGISEKMRSQIRGLAQSQRNIQDGVSMVQTAEGNLDEVHSILQRVRELAVQYKNGSLSTAGKGAIQSEVDAAVVRDHAHPGCRAVQRHQPARHRVAVTFQVGANDGQTIVDHVLGRSPSSSYADAERRCTLATIDADVDNASAPRAPASVRSRTASSTRWPSRGSYQENLTSAESRIRDVDMAEEMVTLTKNQILQQAGTAMLAQANQAPQAVLQLLR